MNIVMHKTIHIIHRFYVHKTNVLWKLRKLFTKWEWKMYI